jgi:uncharacterized Tic20 family protein
MEDPAVSYEDLKALDELRRTGAITEEEYQQEKQKVLSGTEASQAVPAPGSAPQPAPTPGPQPGYAQPGYTQQGYAQQAPPPPPYAGQPTTGPATSKPLFGMAENTYLMLMHLSQFLGAIIPGLGLAAPIILWALNKDANQRVDATGKRIFNFLISYAIYCIAASFLIFAFIGLVLLPVLAVLVVVFVILAAVKANNGEDWDYPLSIKFFH